MEFSPSKIFYLTVGLLVGAAAVTGIFYFALLRNPRITPTKQESKTFNLSLTNSPEDGLATSESKVKIAGITSTEAVVVINGGAADTIIQTAGGKFETTYTLVEGENELTITAFDQNTGEAKTIKRNLLYLTDLKGI